MLRCKPYLRFGLRGEDRLRFRFRTRHPPPQKSLKLVPSGKWLSMRRRRIGECATVATEAVLRPCYGLDREGVLSEHDQAFQLHEYTARQWRVARQQRELEDDESIGLPVDRA